MYAVYFALRHHWQIKKLSLKSLKNIDLAPMLFLPFVENAFKHGISNIHPSYVYVGINQTGQTLKIEVRNSIFPEKAENLEEEQWNRPGKYQAKIRFDLSRKI